jgi:2-hydroxy-6-oxonona-2,4-dienedioate hydrolase
MQKRLSIAAFIVGGTLAGVGLVWSLFQRDMAELEARVVGRSERVQSPFGSIEYASAGAGAPVLVIHGSGGGFDQGLEMVGPLAIHGYRLIAPSRFGYLGSDFPSVASPQSQADAFADLLDRLGEKKVAVFGGSAGALSAMQFAIRHPERCSALVLMVPATFSPARAPNKSAFEGTVGEFLIRRVLQSDFLFWAAVTVAPESMTRMLLATEPRVIAAAPVKEQERARRILRHILPVSKRSEGLWLDMRTAGAPPRYELERITCPVLAISAKDDLYGTSHSAEYTAANVPRGKLVLYESGGHILIGRDEEVWKTISAFLRDSRETRNNPVSSIVATPAE